jgi:hypothetical protein
MAVIAGMHTARVVSTLLRLTAVPPPRHSFTSSRALWASHVTCSAADPPPVQLVSRGTASSGSSGGLPFKTSLSQMCFRVVLLCTWQIRKKKRRLDEVCLERHPEHSRNVIQSWIAQGESPLLQCSGSGSPCCCCC